VSAYKIEVYAHGCGSSKRNAVSFSMQEASFPDSVALPGAVFDRYESPGDKWGLLTVKIDV
jgi:hypothetical protein